MPTRRRPLAPDTARRDRMTDLSRAEHLRAMCQPVIEKARYYALEADEDGPFIDFVSDLTGDLNSLIGNVEDVTPTDMEDAA